MPVRAILTSHPVAVTLSHVVHGAAHLDEARTPRHPNVSYEDFHPGPRRIARFAQRPLDSRRTLPLPRALMVLHRPGRHEDEEVATLTTHRCGRQAAPTAGVGRHFGGLLH
jgi:hypothetical protein